MSYIPTIAFMWYGRGYSRVLYIPTAISLRLFSNGREIPEGNRNDKITSINHLISTFCSKPNRREDELLDEVFDDIGKMPGCMEDYIEYDAVVDLGEVPSGMAIVQWYVRSV